jgi:hypothetical protein
MIGGWYGWPPKPMLVKYKKSFKKFDLTGDRPLAKSEAQKLSRWWASQPLFQTEIVRFGKYYSVFAYKEIWI